MLAKSDRFPWFGAEAEVRSLSLLETLPADSSTACPRQVVTRTSGRPSWIEASTSLAFTGIGGDEKTDELSDATHGEADPGVAFKSMAKK